MCTCTHYAVVRMLRENFDRHLTHTLCKNYSQDSRAFESVGISRCMCGVSEFNAGQIQSQGDLVSDTSSEFPRSVYCGSAQNTHSNSLMCFTLVQNCWRWLSTSLILLSSSAKKETHTKIGSSCVAVRDLFCSWPICACVSRTVPHLLIGNWFRRGFVWTTLAMKPVFLRPFANALIIYLPGQRSWKTVCCAASCEGNDRWRL